MHLTSLTEITGKYRGAIIDLWGVIHDGSALYPGAAEMLQHLRAQHTRVVFLSNAPRQAHKAQEVLDRLGVAREWYDAIVTSGQVAHDALAATPRWGKRYYYLGPEKDCDVLADLDFENVGIEQAGFILNAGYEYDYQPEAEAEPLIAKLLARKLPLLCINPDYEVVKQDGTQLLCAGALAQRYAELGGEVHYVGKPYPEVYETCRNLLGLGNADILAIGDNLDTDIRGANAQQIVSALITGGILARKLEPATDKHAALQALIAESGTTPTYIANYFGHSPSLVAAAS